MREEAYNKELYIENLNQVKGELKSYLLILLQHMMKSVVQNNYRDKGSWRRSVDNSSDKIIGMLKKSGALRSYYYSLDESSFSVSSGFSNEFDNIKKDAWNLACNEIELPIPFGSSEKEVFNNAYKENEAIFMSWSLEDLADKGFINNFMVTYMQDYVGEDFSRYLK